MTLPIGLENLATTAAPLAGVPRRDALHGHDLGCRFVADEFLQLKVGPTVHLRPLPLSELVATFTNPREVLQDDHISLLESCDDPLAYLVVFVPTEPIGLASKFGKVSFGGTSSSRLQGTPEASVSPTDGVQVLGIEELSVTGDGNVLDSTVDSDDPPVLRGIGEVVFHDEVEEDGVSFDDQLRTLLSPMGILTEALGKDEGSLHPPIDREEGDLSTIQEDGHGVIVVADAALFGPRLNEWKFFLLPVRPHRQHRLHRLHPGGDGELSRKGFSEDLVDLVVDGDRIEVSILERPSGHEVEGTSVLLDGRQDVTDWETQLQFDRPLDGHMICVRWMAIKFLPRWANTFEEGAIPPTTEAVGFLAQFT